MATKKKKKRVKRKLSSARRKAEKSNSGFEHPTIKAPEGIDFLRFQTDGIKRLDILPYVVKVGSDIAEVGEWHYEKTFYEHRIGANHHRYICPKRTIGKRCPICEEAARLQRDPDADPDIVKSLYAKQRELFYVIDNDEPEKGVQIWDMSYHLFGKKLDARIRNSDEDDNYDTFFDPEDGMTLKIGMEEVSLGQYTFYSAETIDFKSRKDSIDPELFEDLPSLDDLVKIEKYDKLKAIFHQEDEDDEDEEDEEDRLDSELAEIVSNDSSEDEDDDEEEDDDVEDDEDDDDEDW